MFYFGPWNGKGGHRLRDEQGFMVLQQHRVGVPWNDWHIDGKLQPDLAMQPEGKAAMHWKDGWTALSFWDRSIDGQMMSSSTYLAQGTFTFEEMVELARTRFAERWNKMKFQVVEAK
jgi:hypothetical protein